MEKELNIKRASNVDMISQQVFTSRRGLANVKKIAWYSHTRAVPAPGATAASRSHPAYCGSCPSSNTTSSSTLRPGNASPPRPPAVSSNERSVRRVVLSTRFMHAAGVSAINRASRLAARHLTGIHTAVLLALAGYRYGATAAPTMHRQRVQRPFTQTVAWPAAVEGELDRNAWG
jgi:hypothetical protein